MTLRPLAAPAAGTRRAIPEADAAAALFAFRRWRDESGAVLREARCGIAVPRPACPMLCVVSAHDGDVPPAITRAMAEEVPKVAGRSIYGGTPGDASVLEAIAALRRRPKGEPATTPLGE